MSRWTLWVGAILLLSACGGLPFSSGKLSGSEVPNPADWTGVGDAEVIQLETNPKQPYSVNLWVVAMAQALYVHAGDNRTTWVEHIEQDPAVRLGHEDKIYLLTATRVTDGDEFSRLSEVYKAKYGNYPRNSNLAEIYLYRLTPRP